MIDPQTSITDFIAFIKKEKGYSLHTVKSYTHDLHRFNDYMTTYCGTRAWAYNLIDRKTIRYFLGREFEAGFSSKTVARRLATLKSFCKYLYKNGIFNQNPATSVRTPKTSKNLPVIIPEKLITKLMSSPPNNDKGIRDKAILILFYSSGIRLSELVNLNLGDFKPDPDPKTGTEKQSGPGLVKVIGKGQKERIVPYGKNAGRALADYWLNRGLSLKTCDPNEPCFVNSQGKRLSGRTIQRRVTKYIKLVTDGTSIGPHTLRHSFATHMINTIKDDNTIDIRALQELLGHASLSATQIYTQIQEEHMKKIYKQAHPHGK